MASHMVVLLGGGIAWSRLQSPLRKYSEGSHGKSVTTSSGLWRRKGRSYKSIFIRIKQENECPPYKVSSWNMSFQHWNNFHGTTFSSTGNDNASVTRNITHLKWRIVCPHPFRTRSNVFSSVTFLNVMGNWHLCVFTFHGSHTECVHLSLGLSLQLALTSLRHLSYYSTKDGVLSVLLNDELSEGKAVDIQ